LKKCSSRERSSVVQLYINKDRGFTRDLVKRVEAAGCPALMLTVDTPEWGRRECDVAQLLSSAAWLERDQPAALK